MSVVLTPVAPSAPPSGVREKSSTARPSSAPVASTSDQRIQKVAPLGMLRPVMVELMTLRLAAALPSDAPVAPVVMGGVKSSASTSVYVPVVRLVALVLYWKSQRSAMVRPVAPRRHC